MRAWHSFMTAFVYFLCGGSRTHRRGQRCRLDLRRKLDEYDRCLLTGTGPWTLNWAVSFVQSGIASSPASAHGSRRSSTTTYSVTSVTDANCVSARDRQRDGNP